MNWWRIRTPDGVFLARYSAKGLAELRFPLADLEESKACESSFAWHALTTVAVLKVLRGEHLDELPPLDFTGHTTFRVRVWEQLRGISLGETATYAEIAHRLSAPGAARAVGGACGANPIPLLIPCHRVLAAGGKIGGFSGGLPWKRRLLRAEGVNLQPDQELLEFGQIFDSESLAAT
jgi:O-6-methylguanine DNA methyltransferase